MSWLPYNLGQYIIEYRDYTYNLRHCLSISYFFQVTYYIKKNKQNYLLNHNILIGIWITNSLN